MSETKKLKICKNCIKWNGHCNSFNSRFINQVMSPNHPACGQFKERKN